MRRSIKTRSVRAALLLGAALLIVLISAGCGHRSSEEVPADVSQAIPTAEVSVTPAPEMLYTLTVDEQTGEGDTVLVSTSYGTVRYPFAFSDLLRMEAENATDHASLKFFAVIDDVDVPVYTVVFNGQEDIFLGSLSIPDAENEVPVYAEIHTSPAELAEDDLGTFYAVQETFNDVVISLEENVGFSPGEQK